jgi:predicted molibdopterin-dependent oxidoreductase YjgC
VQKVRLTIDDRAVEAAPGQTILEVATRLGIKIPTLCHDPRLKPFGACRVCLVEVEKARTLQTACSAEIQEGMVVRTNTQKVMDTRRFILELILSDHPLDCMTCDKCGTCTLQDLAYEYGIKESRFFRSPQRGIAPDPNTMILRDDSKCILCGRCVRICDEVEQAEALDFINRGFDTVVGPAYGDTLLGTTCEFCGQCVSTCPVGALREKQAEGKGRNWELKKTQTVCAYCGVGCNLFLNVNTRTGKLVKVTSEVGTVPNNGNLCIKGRFGYDFVHHPDRITQPLIRKNGRLEEASWEEAMGLIASRLLEIKKKHGPQGIACIGSARCTNEENYLMMKFARAVMGTNSVDMCART